MNPKPLFQRRHYEFIAKLLNDSDEKDWIVDRFVKALREDNPNFDSNRFRKAIKNG